MSKQQLNTAYLEAFCDRDIDKVLNAEERAKLYERRADLKVALKQETDQNKIAQLKEKLDEVTRLIQSIS